MVEQYRRASDGIGVRLHRRGENHTLQSIRDRLGADPTNEEIATMMQQMLQRDHDTIIERADLPADDPDKTVDPDRLDLFWRNTKLVSRSTVYRVRWAGGQYHMSARIPE